MASEAEKLAAAKALQAERIRYRYGREPAPRCWEESPEDIRNMWLDAASAALEAAEKVRGEEDVFVNTDDSLHGDVDIQVRGMTENYGVLRPIVAVVKRGYKLVIRKASEGGQ